MHLKFKAMDANKEEEQSKKDLGALGTPSSLMFPHFVFFTCVILLTGISAHIYYSFQECRTTSPGTVDLNQRQRYFSDIDNLIRE